MRTKLMKGTKIRSTSQMIKYALGFRLKDFLPEVPAISEYTTSRTMGEDCDIMVAKHQLLEKNKIYLQLDLTIMLKASKMVIIQRGCCCPSRS